MQAVDIKFDFVYTRGYMKIIERELQEKIEPYIESKQAIIITGMRRVGKTTLLQNIYKNIASENKMFFDLENVVEQKLFDEEDYNQIKITLERKGLDFSKPAYLFLDEIQSARNMPSVVKYLIDHYGVKFFLTGSASFYLKNLFSESLAGRKYIFELYPFSFREFSALKNIHLSIPEPESRIAYAEYIMLDNLYAEYLSYGGFPEVIIAKTEAEKHRILEDIISSYIQLEVRRLSDFKKINALRDMMFILAESVGQKLDVKKLSITLKIARDTVMDYLAFLESTYFIALVNPFSRNRTVEIRKTPKLYFCDSGLANHLAKINQGSLFEQNIFQSLRIKGDLNYYKKKTGAEIDFILDKKIGYEVKTNPSEHDAKRLYALSNSLGLEKYYIISKAFNESLPTCLYGFQL